MTFGTEYSRGRALEEIARIIGNIANPADVFSDEELESYIGDVAVDKGFIKASVEAVKDWIEDEYIEPNELYSYDQLEEWAKAKGLVS